MPELYIGLMSGTSMDGVDAVLVAFDEERPRLLASHSAPMPESLREALLRLAGNHSPHPLQCFGELDHRLGQLFADASLALLEAAGMAPEAVTAIGSHGQTLYHQPLGDAPFSLQIGDPNIIAERTGITTVADFRRRDMAAGGQGAPLVPAFHAEVFAAGHTRVVLNLGGIANITVLPGAAAAPVTGFDTGPGNVLLDGWAQRHLGVPLDRDGAWARSGRVDPPLLDRLLGDPYFQVPPPKSTGREVFNGEWLERQLQQAGRHLAPEDVQATLVELTAASVADAVWRHASGTRELLVCGGGAHNGAVLARLGHHLPDCTVTSTASHGIDPDWVEALAFAWLARRTLQGRPGNLPAVTGARHPVVLGGVFPAGGGA